MTAPYSNAMSAGLLRERYDYILYYVSKLPRPAILEKNKGDERKRARHPKDIKLAFVFNEVFKLILTADALLPSDAAPAAAQYHFLNVSRNENKGRGRGGRGSGVLLDPYKLRREGKRDPLKMMNNRTEKIEEIYINAYNSRVGARFLPFRDSTSASSSGRSFLFYYNRRASRRVKEDKLAAE